MLKTEAIESVLLHECSMWTFHHDQYAKLWAVHYRVLLHLIAAQRKRTDHGIRAFEITAREDVETTVRTRRLWWVGTLIRMSDGRLPERFVFGNLDGVGKRGRVGRKHRSRINKSIAWRVAPAFSIAGDWKGVALEAGVRN